MANDSTDNIFVNARMTPVFFNMGRFDDGSNQIKMVRAPFDIVNLPSNPTSPRTPYLEPLGFDTTGVYQTDNAGYELAQARTGMAWVANMGMVISQSEMGDLSDNWRGLNYFSLL